MNSIQHIDELVKEYLLVGDIPISVPYPREEVASMEHAMQLCMYILLAIPLGFLIFAPFFFF